MGSTESNHAVNWPGKSDFTRHLKVCGIMRCQETIGEANDSSEVRLPHCAAGEGDLQLLYSVTQLHSAPNNHSSLILAIHNTNNGSYKSSVYEG